VSKKWGPLQFNLNRVLSGRHSEDYDDFVILVEGFFDCMKVHQAGLPNVVALMGSSMSGAQERLLQQFEDVILFLDGDPTGREGASTIASRLMYQSFVRAINVPDGRQPDQLLTEEIKSLLCTCF